MNGDESTGVLLLDELDEGTSDVCSEMSPDELELSHDSFDFNRLVALAAKVTRSQEMYTVRGQIKCAAGGECCRCLTPVEHTISPSLSLLIHRREASEEELEAVEDEEIEIVDPGTREFDLRKFVREEIILELPLRLYCREDCKGLCTSCGQDLNQGDCDCTEDSVDPRWAALGNIKFSEESAN